LVIAGIVQDTEYFERRVAPHLDGERVRYVGPVGPAERDRLLGGAIALLHLIGFDEPFGLSVVESLAAGTPVIAFRRGSMSELIRPGVTGYLVGDELEAVDAVRAVGGLDRSQCRADAVERFSADRMVADYDGLFARIVGD
jgi:glycosyltransferase involved in cell wall biosynthesis